jgi:hypothetical protein
MKQSLPARRGQRSLPARLTVAASLAISLAISVSGLAQVPTDLTGARFAPNCGAANATQIFADGFLASGQAGINDMQIVSDPDVVLIGNQWWLIFASNPGPTRGIEPVAAYLPPGVSLSYTGVFPADPNGWHLVGAKADGTGKGVAIAGTPSPAGWDNIAAETPSIDVGPDGSVSVYYAGHNLGATNFEIGLMPNVVNGVSPGEDPVPAMVAVQPWEYADGLGAILEQSVRWHPELNKFIMYYTAAAWWDQPPTNDIAYAESTDGVTWTNRQHLGFPKSYYNQDFLYNSQRNRYEMVVSNDPTGVGGGNGRDLVWLDSATPGTHFSDWQNQITLLDHTSPGTPTWRDQGLLSPAIKYGNLPGEENRIYVFFHAYGSADPMSIARFYCDAINVTDPGYKIASAEPFLNLAPGASSSMPISINPINGFSGTVNVSVSGAPAGSSTSYISSSPTAGTLNVAVAANAPQGRYPITVTGTSGNLTQATTFTLNVSGQDQTITIQPLSPNNISYTPGLTYTIDAAASSGLPVTLRVGGNGTLNGNVLTVTGGGDIIIAANQGGNGTYNPAPEATTTLFVAPEVQTVNVAPIPAQTVGGTLDLGKYISTSSGLTGYTYVGISPTICTNNGSALTFVGAGTCTVIVIQFGNSDYAPAGVAASIQVNPATPKIIWAPPATIAYGTPLGTAQLNAIASVPGTFVYSPAAGTILAAGPYMLTAQFTPTDTTDYTTATAQVPLTVVQPTVTLGVASGTQTYEVWTNFVIGPIFKGSRVPTGKVTLYDNGTAVVTLPLGGDGKAYYTTNPPLNAGSNTLTASYSGDAYFPSGLSAPVTITVLPAPVNFQASCWGAQWYGASYQCTVNLSASTTTQPGGVIAYSLDGGAPVTVPIVNGNAPFTLPTDPSVGGHTLILTYAAQGNFAAAGPLTKSFTTPPGQTALQAYPSSYWLAAGSALTISGKATTTNSGSPSGSVTIYDNGVAIGSSPIGASGAISYNVSNITKGSHKYSASYPGSSNYTAATSAASTVTAN